jgi:anti-anti-sigma factor
MDAGMKIEHPNVLVIFLEGEIDGSTGPVIDAYVAAAMESGQRRITFDLSAVEFLDTQGLYALVRARKALLANGGDCRSRHPSQPAERLLDLVQIDGVMPVDR